MPDFIVFTGDWITYRDSRQFNQLRQIMPHIPHGRLGTVGILGNHDYGFNWRMVDVAQRVTEIELPEVSSLWYRESGGYYGCIRESA